MGSSLGIVFGQAMGSMEDRQSPVRVFVDAHHGAHEVRPQRVRRDLQGEPAPFEVLSLPTRRSSWTHKMSRTRPVRSATKALPISAGATAKAALWAGQ